MSKRFFDDTVRAVSLQAVTLHQSRSSYLRLHIVSDLELNVHEYIPNVAE
jgi:hypothetical protein